MLNDLLRSVSGQTHRPVEAVVVDDGSTDETGDVVSSYISKSAGSGDLSFVYERLERGGAQVARNRGVAVATGSALMFVDSDDCLTSAGIAHLARELERQSSCTYVYGKVQTVDSRLMPFTASRTIGSSFGNDAKGLFGYHWHTMGALYTRECVNRVGLWNEALTFSQDWEYQVRVKLFGGSNAFVDELVGCWRQHDEARIGIKGFSSAFLESVEPLFVSIDSHASRAGRNSRDFQALLARRLIVHAVGCGANGQLQAKKRLLTLASKLAPHSISLRALALAVSRLPAAGDRLLSSAHAKLLGCNG
jgi:glycosyltransferase involved in cell wall biosynthesis